MRNTILGSLLIMLATSAVSCATVDNCPEDTRTASQQDTDELEKKELGILDGFEFFNLLHSVGRQPASSTLTSSR